MTARQPRRARRRTPAASLPRPTAVAVDASGVESRRMSAGRRTHHVTTDYGYVHRDLIAVAVIGGTVFAFIVAMSFVL